VSWETSQPRSHKKKSANWALFSFSCGFSAATFASHLAGPEIPRRPLAVVLLSICASVHGRRVITNPAGGEQGGSSEWKGAFVLRFPGVL
jgi:hypothetical protein